MNRDDGEVEDFDEVDELVLSVRAGVIAKLDAATDFPALLAGIYATAANRTLGNDVTARRVES